MSDERPWLRLYRKESPRFCTLPYRVRALHHMLLTRTTNEGAVMLPEGKLYNAIGYVLGADVGTRRRIKVDIEVLLEFGYLSHDADAKTLRFGSWEKRQPCANDARTVRERSPNRAPTVRENRPKSAESLDSGFDNKRQSQKKSQKNPPTPQEGGEADDAPLPSADPVELHAMAKAALEGAGGSSFPNGARWYPMGEKFMRAAVWLETEGTRRSVDPTALFAEALRGFIADPSGAKSRYSAALLMHDLGRWLPLHAGPSTDPDDYDPSRDGVPKDAANLPTWNAYCSGMWTPEAQLRIAK